MILYEIEPGSAHWLKPCKGKTATTTLALAGRPKLFNLQGVTTQHNISYQIIDPQNKAKSNQRLIALHYVELSQQNLFRTNFVFLQYE